MDRGEILVNWKNANILLIYKKGDRIILVNYKLVLFRVVIFKLLEFIIVF